MFLILHTLRTRVCSNVIARVMRVHSYHDYVARFFYAGQIFDTVPKGHDCPINCQPTRYLYSVIVTITQNFPPADTLHMHWRRMAAHGEDNSDLRNVPDTVNLFAEHAQAPPPNNNTTNAPPLQEANLPSAAVQLKWDWFLATAKRHASVSSGPIKGSNDWIMPDVDNVPIKGADDQTVPDGRSVQS